MMPPRPDAHRRYGHLLSHEKFYCIDGLVEASFGTITVTVRKLETFAA
jgi:hypothetical protein